MMFGSLAPGGTPGWGDYLGGIAAVLGDGYAAYRGRPGGHLDSLLDDHEERRKRQQALLAQLSRRPLQPAVIGPHIPYMPRPSALRNA